MEQVIALTVWATLSVRFVWGMEWTVYIAKTQGFVVHVTVQGTAMSVMEQDFQLNEF